MGYLHLTKQTERLEELIEWCIQKVGEKMGREQKERHYNKRKKATKQPMNASSQKNRKKAKPL